MKIDADLRAAVRSAEKAQPYSHELERAAAKRAIDDLCKRKPAVMAALRSAALISKKIDALWVENRTLLNRIGINKDGDHITDEQAFVKIGGKLPGPREIRWRFDRVMADLAAADAKEAAAILKQCGINWK